MTWKDVGSFIKSTAPTVGGLLFGPAGAKVGQLVSSALSVDPDPDKVLEVLKSNPDAIVKVREIEANRQIELAKIGAASIQEDTKQLQAINETMRAEAASEHWWASAWRPFWGFISAVAFLVAVVFVCVLAYRAIVNRDKDAMAMIPTFIFNMAALFAIPGGILGVAAWHRGMMQREQAGGEGK